MSESSNLRSLVTKNVRLLVPVLFSSLGITGGGFHSDLGVSSSSPPSSSIEHKEILMSHKPWQV